MVVVDFGCGRRKHPGTIGLDRNPRSDADIICDLNHPVPLPDSSVDGVICKDVLEHVGDLVFTMEEIHRICKPGAKVEIQGPFASSPEFFHDPTHRRAFTSQSFDYFIEGTPAAQFRYSDAYFRLEKVYYSRGRVRLLDRLFLSLANRFKRQFEARFLFWYPVNTIHFVLRTVKNGKA